MKAIIVSLGLALMALPASAQMALHSVDGMWPGEGLHTKMAFCGDVNNDGLDDWIVGVPTDDTTGTNDGIARVHSGADASILYTVLYVPLSFQSPGVGFGSSVDGVGDVDADGFDDFIIGASGAPANGFGAVGLARVFSGFDGSQLFEVEGDQGFDRFGTAVAGGGDINNDGTPDFIVGAPGDDFSGQDNSGSVSAGTVHVLTAVSAACSDVTSYCGSLPNSTGVGAFLHYTGTTSVNANDLRLHAADVTPSQPGLFFFGPAQLSLPFGNGLRCVGGTIQRLGHTFADHNGNATHSPDYALPAIGALVTPGSNWNFQFYYRDPGVGAGFNSSDALSIVFCP